MNEKTSIQPGRSRHYKGSQPILRAAARDSGFGEVEEVRGTTRFARGDTKWIRSLRQTAP